MIERSPVFDAVSYVLMAIGLVLVLLPFWVVFIGATLNLQEVGQVPVELVRRSGHTQGVLKERQGLRRASGLDRTG